jgi:hypothetical protein
VSGTWSEPPVVDDEEAGGDQIDDAELLELLDAREFDVACPPKKPKPVLVLGANVISTPGNLTNIQAAAKAGKTATVGAIIAAGLADRICDCPQGCDHRDETLGFASANPGKWAVLHFDTEQSRYDHHSVVTVAMERASMDLPPAWFHSYCITDWTLERRSAAIFAAIEAKAKCHKGVLMVIIDGIADLCVDPNNATEAFALVDRLHRTAIEHECAIITVLHENPGSDIGKMRGHLGSQLERKAETALRLAKDMSTGITTIWSERARHCHISKEHGVCFRWDDTKKRHVSCGKASEIKAVINRSKFEAEVAAAFEGVKSHDYTALCNAIMTTVTLKMDAAKKRVAAYVKEGLVVKDAGGRYSEASAAVA